MNSTFLETVLPSQGTYCVVAIDDASKEIKRQVFHRSLQELEETATGFDTRKLGTFIALASFDDTQTRKAANALFLRSVFLDLDVGPTKKYPDLISAAQALNTFVDTNGLPQPIVVGSGGGVHAYWPFTEDIPADQWQPVARAFKVACLSQGLMIDPTVTADAARILRMPGTSNYKLSYARPVNVLAWGSPPSVFAEFAAKVLGAVEVVDLSAAKAYGTDTLTQSLATGDRPPAKFAKIVRRSINGSGCAQIAQAVTEAATLEEPLWRAALSVAWNCDDAGTAIHKLSSGHPDYTPEATLAKAERLTGKPHTCEWYRSNYPEKCQGCKHKITSPIQLGVVVPEAAVDDGVYLVEAPLHPDNAEHQTTVEVHIPQYPFPYFRGAQGGVFKKDRGDDGEDTQIEIYPYDLYITERFFDSDESGDGEGELVGMNLHLPHDGIRRFHAPVVALLTKDKLRDTLVKYGVVAYGKQLDNIMGYLASSVRKLQSSIASNKTRSQMGWTPEHTFVVGELEYTPSGVKLAPPASGTRQLAPLFHTTGDLDEWSSVVNFYNRPGMEGHAFAFLVGLGSPLLQLLNSTQVRGAVLNLVSNGSGTGKTTVQMAINSIFGHPSELLMAAKDTPASRFQRLGTLNSICMTVDELTTATGEQLSAMVYGSTQGRAPHRMEAQSNKLRSNHTTWCSVTVTSSNSVMSDVLAAYRSAVEGELKRVIDLPMSIPSDVPKSETDALFAKLASNYGLAGPIFMQHVVANIGTVSEALQQMQVKIDGDAKFVRGDRFYSAVMAVAFTAGLLGNKLGLFKLDMRRVYAWALATVVENREVNSVITGTAGTLAVETLSQFVNENISNALVISAGTEGAPSAPVVSPKGSLKMRYEPDTDLLVIACSELRAYFVNRRVDFKASIHEFRTMDALTLDKDGSPSVVRRIAAGAVGGMRTPSTRCYEFKTGRLGLSIPVQDEAPADS